jgi:hypothetical protein
MSRPTKLKLQLAKMFKKETPEQMKQRIRHSIREYNQQGIATNKFFQAER